MGIYYNVYNLIVLWKFSTSFTQIITNVSRVPVYIPVAIATKGGSVPLMFFQAFIATHHSTTVSSLEKTPPIGNFVNA